MKTILGLNGPNLNLFGTRDPEVYGTTSFAEIEAMCRAKATELGCSLDWRQTNHEGVLIDWVQAAGAAAQGIVINPGALAHTSVALHDAIKDANMPIIEIHMSNIYKREEFRHRSYLSSVVNGVICGLGPHGYVTAVETVARLIGQNDSRLT